MSGKDLKNWLFINDISQEKASKILGISRQTLNNWCNRQNLSDKILTKVKLLFNAVVTEKDSKNFNSIVISGENYTTGNIDNRTGQLESIESLKAQILQKDEQISRLLKIIESLTITQSND